MGLGRWFPIMGPKIIMGIPLETNTADKCTYCAHRIEGGLTPACVVACPVEANIFGDIEDETSHISRYIMEHQGDVQVRKPEQAYKP